MALAEYLLDAGVGGAGLGGGGVGGRAGRVPLPRLVAAVVVSCLPQVAGLGPRPRQRPRLGLARPQLPENEVLFMLTGNLFLSIEFLHHADTFLQNFSPPLFLLGTVLCFVFGCLGTFPFKQISEGILEETAAAIRLLRTAAACCIA